MKKKVPIIMRLIHNQYKHKYTESNLSHSTIELSTKAGIVPAGLIFKKRYEIKYKKNKNEFMFTD